MVIDGFPGFYWKPYFNPTVLSSLRDGNKEVSQKVHDVLNKVNKDKSKNIRNLLISIILRLTFSLFFLISIGILDIESYNLFIMNFFAFYLLYIIFEIRILLINLQPT